MRYARRMIARRWRARATEEGAERYRRYLAGHVVPVLQSIPGFCGLYLFAGADEADAQIAIEVVTLWESFHAIRDFAAPDIDLAVVDAEAAATLIDYDRRVVHCSVTHFPSV